MKKYIKTTFYISFISGVLVLLVAAFGLFYTNKLNDLKQNLKLIAQSIKVSELPVGESLSDYAVKLGDIDPELRVTLISPQGQVLGDSHGDFEDMENHSDRKEIKDAMIKDFGEDVRTSSTTGVRTLYVACMIDGNVILRLSYPFSVTFSFFATIIPVVAILLILMLFLFNNFANRFSKRLILPLEKINTQLSERTVSDSVNEYKSFKELDPILTNLDYMINRLKYDLEEMRKTEQIRNDFVANVSHELKSPLTSIKGFAELMATGLVTDSQKQSDYLNRIVVESDRLLVLINDILHLSEVNNTQLDKTSLEKINLSKIAAEVITSLDMQAKKKKISLSFTGGGTVTATSKDIWEIIYNLVDNAIKYGKNGGYVKVILDNNKITVKDNGIGIPPDQQNRIFERFYRVDKARSRNAGGTGLGLSLVKNIAAKYGGCATVDSEINCGSTFTVKFNS